MKIFIQDQPTTQKVQTKQHSQQKKINTKITLGSTKTVKLGKQMSIYGNQDLQKISGYIWLMKYAPINIR